MCPCDYKVNGLGAVFIFKEKKKRYVLLFLTLTEQCSIFFFLFLTIKKTIPNGLMHTGIVLVNGRWGCSVEAFIHVH